MSWAKREILKLDSLFYSRDYDEQYDFKIKHRETLLLNTFNSFLASKSLEKIDHLNLINQRNLTQDDKFELNKQVCEVMGYGEYNFYLRGINMSNYKTIGDVLNRYPIDSLVGFCSYDGDFRSVVLSTIVDETLRVANEMMTDSSKRLIPREVFIDRDDECFINLPNSKVISLRWDFLGKMTDEIANDIEKYRDDIIYIDKGQFDLIYSFKDTDILSKLSLKNFINETHNFRMINYDLGRPFAEVIDKYNRTFSKEVMEIVRESQHKFSGNVVPFKRKAYNS